MKSKTDDESQTVKVQMGIHYSVSFQLLLYRFELALNLDPKRNWKESLKHQIVTT